MLDSVGVIDTVFVKLGVTLIVGVTDGLAPGTRTVPLINTGDTWFTLFPFPTCIHTGNPLQVHH